jgi:hypothetical protein
MTWAFIVFFFNFAKIQIMLVNPTTLPSFEGPLDSVVQKNQVLWKGTY